MEHVVREIREEGEKQALNVTELGQGSREITVPTITLTIMLLYNAVAKQTEMQGNAKRRGSSFERWSIGNALPHFP